LKGINPSQLCYNSLFRLYRSFHVILCAAFFVIQGCIRKRVNQIYQKQQVLTPYDCWLKNHQLRQLKQLRKAVTFFFISNMALIILDFLSFIHANGEHCNSSFFKNDSYNALLYFFSRSMSCDPA